MIENAAAPLRNRRTAAIQDDAELRLNGVREKDLRTRKKIENRWNQRITSAFLKASQATPRPRLRLGAAGFAPENLH